MPSYLVTNLGGDGGGCGEWYGSGSSGGENYGGVVVEVVVEVDVISIVEGVVVQKNNDRQLVAATEGT